LRTSHSGTLWRCAASLRERVLDQTVHPQIAYEWLREANPAVRVPEFETRSCILTRSLTSVATERTRDLSAVDARFPTRCWKADIDREARTLNTSAPECDGRAARAVLGVDFGLDCKRYARLRLLDDVTLRRYLVRHRCSLARFASEHEAYSWEARGLHLLAVDPAEIGDDPLGAIVEILAWMRVRLSAGRPLSYSTRRAGGCSWGCSAGRPRLPSAQRARHRARSVCARNRSAKSPAYGIDRNVAATSAIAEMGSISAWLSRRSVLALSPALSPMTEDGVCLIPSAARLRNRSCSGPVAASERTIGPREHYQCPWWDLMKRWGI
jgi:predicted site-specific integrase-resolvase